MAIPQLLLNGHSVLVPTEISGPLFERARQESAIMKLARQVPFTEGGAAVPVLTGDIEADWVGEGEAKYVSSTGLDVKQLVPKKVATIIPFSEELARNVPYIVSLLQDRGAEAIARAFDVAAILGKKTTGAGAGPFADYLAKTTLSTTVGTATAAQGGIFGDLIAAGGQVQAAGLYSVTGAALDLSQGVKFWGASFDSTGRPFDKPQLPFDVAYQKLTHYDNTVAGVMGDFNQAVYGVGVNLQVRLSNQATLKVGTDLLPLWQHNMVGLLLEAVYGFAVGNLAAFTKLAV